MTTQKQPKFKPATPKAVEASPRILPDLTVEPNGTRDLRHAPGASNSLSALAARLKKAEISAPKASKSRPIPTQDNPGELGNVMFWRDGDALIIVCNIEQDRIDDAPVANGKDGPSPWATVATSGFSGAQIGEGLYLKCWVGRRAK